MSYIKNLEFNYESFQLRIPDLEIKDLGITIVHGVSGSGKSTLFNILLGLLDTSTMHWEFKGNDLAKLKPSGRNIAVVFQELGLFPHMTGVQNIQFAADARGMSKEKYKKRLRELSEKLNISDFKDQNVKEMSGGQRQRIALARALIWQPEFLFLDEPYSALDEDNKTTIRQAIEELSIEIPVLMISHDQRDIENPSYEKIHLHRGEVLLTRKPY
ncbi:MAG: ATP-binding cassette domain-containing protein [Bdellovibrionaceae bacterium]|jgi:ABC-type sugar transport system ATPase subunit|nr:ATP-binding cassette domain-containing protein [Pseudobdellovibrionaceae bacterium]